MDSNPPATLQSKNMDQNYLIQLTNNLYKLTLLFPKKEPLRYKMREVADEILANPIEKKFEILDGFFEVAKSQNWVSPSEVLAIQKEYDNLKGKLEKVNPPAGGPPAGGRPTGGEKKEKDFREDSSLAEALPQLLVSQRLPERQEKILAFLKENGRAQVWEIKQVFPEVTKRTLRRDFEQMLNQGMVERIGERNNTFYQIKIVSS